jgi:hypothetical protein
LQAGLLAQPFPQRRAEQARGGKNAPAHPARGVAAVRKLSASCKGRAGEEELLFIIGHDAPGLANRHGPFGVQRAGSLRNIARQQM